MKQPATWGRCGPGRTSRRLAAGVLLALSCTVAGSAGTGDGTQQRARDAADNQRLNQPAAATGHAARSAMQAVAAAGKRTVAVGERGLIVYSDDCGGHWQQARVPVSVTLTAVQFVDERQGWAVGHGGVVLATHDAGSSWEKVLDGRAIGRLAVAAAQERGAAGDGAAPQMARDADRLLADGPDKPLFAVHFWNGQRGIVAGAYGLVLITEDAGQHWQWVSGRVPNPQGLHLYGLWARGQQVFIVGEQGLVVASDDAGAHFERIASPYAGSFFGIAGPAGGDAGALTVYGLRGHSFELSPADRTLRPMSAAGNVALVHAAMLPGGVAMLFDANGQVMRVVGGRTSVVGGSPVGPVLGAQACGDTLVLAGLRGVAAVNQETMVVAGQHGARE